MTVFNGHRCSSQNQTVQVPENVHVSRQASFNKLLISTNPHQLVVFYGVQDTARLW